MYDKILLAIDGSDHSFRSAEEVVRIASVSNNCKVTIIHVADISKAKDEILHSHTKEELEFNRRQKFIRFEELLKENNVNYDFKIFHGDPAQVIIDYANEGDFELLVLGSKGKGHNFLHEMMLGSVSHKIVKRVSIPALIVK
jgi:nucleotide-binding universal stress UspA family protein